MLTPMPWPRRWVWTVALWLDGALQLLEPPIPRRVGGWQGTQGAPSRVTLSDGTEIAILFQQRTLDGVVRLERWPEGLLLWVGGEIRWRQWDVDIDTDDSDADADAALFAPASDRDSDPDAA